MLAADLIETHRDIERTARRCAFEQQVLEKVCRPERAGCLVARAHCDPESDGRTAGTRNTFAEDTHPTGEYGTPHQRVARSHEGEVGEAEGKRNCASHPLEHT